MVRTKTKVQIKETVGNDFTCCGFQVRDGAMSCLVEIYRHVGERVRMDLSKKGLPQSRLNVIFSKFDEVQRSGNMMPSSVSDKNFEDEESVDGGRSSSSSSSKAPPGGRRTVISSVRRPSSASANKPTSKEAAAGAVDEDDFIKAYEDVPSIQIYSNRELEDHLAKIREVLSDEKHDWEHRVVALKKVRSLLIAGATEYEGFPQQLRLLEAPLKLSAKDLRSQVVREACITLGHLSLILGNKFDHGAESIMPTLLNLVPNSAKIMATSGVATIRLLLRRTHYPRLIPIITSNCAAKSVAVRRRCFEFLDLMLQEWPTNTLERHVAVLTETIKKGIHDADSEARSIARNREAEHLFQALESPYQKALQSHLKGSDSIVSLPQSDRSSSSSQESLNRPLSVKSVIGGSMTRSKLVGSRVSPSSGSLQRSRSDIDVNAASSSKSRLSTVPASSPFSSAAALPPGSYASLGRVRTRRQSSGSTGGASPSVVDSRGRSRAKIVSQSQRTRQSLQLPGEAAGPQQLRRVPRASVSVSTTPADKRSRVPRSQGCSRDTSPTRLGLASLCGKALLPAALPYRTLARSRIPRPSMSQGCSRDTSRESSRDTSPARGFTPLDKNFEDEESVDGGRSSSSSSSKAPPGGRRTVISSVRRPSSASANKPTSKEAAAGAVDEDDFIKAYEDVPSIQIYSNRELEDHLAKIREVLSDEKHDWEHRLKKVRSLLIAGATEYEGFPQQLRLLEAPLKLSAKDLRSQVVREACITLGHLSLILGNKFDHGAESIMPTLLNLVPNSAKIMATSGVATIRLLLRRTHYPRLIPIITSNCAAKSVAVRRRCFEFLDLMLQEWPTNTLERHVAVLTETIKKGIHDADSEARSIARNREAEHLFQALESPYQKALQSHLKGSDSIVSLPQSDRSSSSSQESLNRPLSVKSVIGGSMTRSKLVGSRVSPSSGSLQRSRSDIDVNAASSSKSRLSTVPASSPFSSAAALPPGSYASLGRVRTRRQSSGSTGGASPSVVDSRGRSRAKIVSQSQPGSRSSSPGKLLGHSSYGRVPRASVSVSTTPADKRSRVPQPRLQPGHQPHPPGPRLCGKALLPAALPYRTLARSRIPRPSMSQGCSRDTSRESSRDTSPARGFTPLAHGPPFPTDMV
ncbi:hypothetical protein F7725_001575 [Dissostichus mawsoni]|uniref:TOG domain-containing protein n=1 Tax=Dissostichus mawsoni TaxID=36200 RepID=A0A7J5Y021_DISMA|nr:hypothetical protein F7725_001575 [Dissostichus mawsoni]